MKQIPAPIFSAVVTVVLATAACGGDDDVATLDTAAAVVTREAVMAAGPRRGPPRDADHEFLRRMSDHHQGLVMMAASAMSRGSNEQVRDDAQLLHLRHERETREMIGMIQSAYDQAIDAIATPEHRAMNDSLQAMTGAGYDRAFYRMVVQHHRDGIRLIDEFRPRVQRADVRQLMDRMRSEKERAIQELERKAAGRAGQVRTGGAIA